MIDLRYLLIWYHNKYYFSCNWQKNKQIINKMNLKINGNLNFLRENDWLVCNLLLEFFILAI